MRDRLRRLGPAAAGWAVPFTVILVLGLKNGGYDIAIRSEVGIAVWWILLVGVAAGLIALNKIGRTGWILLGLLAAFAVWTGLGIGWSESAERSVIELARVLTLLGILGLALAVQGRDGLRRTVAATGAAIAVIGLIALLSRLHPSWFDDARPDPHSLAVEKSRLNYPLNYWNALAALMALGIPLMLTMALRGRSLIGQALAAAAVPMMALTAFYTFSRGGAIEIGVALAAFILLYPRRLTALPILLVTGTASAILIAAATQRDALENGLFTGAADTQRDEMIALVLVVCAGAALLALAFGLARRYRLGPRIEVSRQAAGGLAAIVAVVTLVIAVAAGVPGELQNRWDDFKSPAVPGSTTAARFESSSGSGRYQTWQSAIDANETAPLTGIGPGTFEFWWAQEGTIAGFVRDAHSLYLETLGELGIIGFVLIVALVGGVLVIGVRRLLAASEDRRALLAGAIAACAAFAFSAAVDWTWEVAVLPGAFLLLAAGIAGPTVARRRIGAGRREPDETTADRGRGRGGLALRLAAVVVSVAALIGIAIPYAGSAAVADSRDDVRAGNLGSALSDAETAISIQPYAASGHLQKALVLERQGDYDGAATAARQATAADSTDWRTWLTLSRIEAYRGDAQASVAAYRKAESLNPRSTLFTNPR